MTTDPIMTVTSQETGALVDLETALALAGYGVPMGAAHIKLDESGKREPSFVVYASFRQTVGGYIMESSYCFNLGDGEYCY